MHVASSADPTCSEFRCSAMHVASSSLGRVAHEARHLLNKLIMNKWVDLAVLAHTGRATCYCHRGSSEKHSLSDLPKVILVVQEEGTNTIYGTFLARPRGQTLQSWVCFYTKMRL